MLSVSIQSRAFDSFSDKQSAFKSQYLMFQQAIYYRITLYHPRQESIRHGVRLHFLDMTFCTIKTGA